MNRPASMSLLGIKLPAGTGAPLSSRTPAVGGVVTLTAEKLFGGLSFASKKPKSADKNVYDASSGIVTVLFVPLGASLTEAIVSETAATLLRLFVACPSLAR